jgi:hypothetical protein
VKPKLQISAAVDGGVRNFRCCEGRSCDPITQATSGNQSGAIDIRSM